MLKQIILIFGGVICLSACARSQNKQTDDSKQGVLNGTVKTYYPNGRVKDERSYVGGKKDGKSIQYYENGGIKSTAIYKDDHFVGDLTFFSKNGMKSSVINYDSFGHETNNFKFWYDNGKLKQEGSDSGDLHVWKSYYRSGSLWFTSYYKNTGLKSPKIARDGTWIYYTEDGKILKKEIYTDDVFDSVAFKDDGWTRSYYNIPTHAISKELHYENGELNGYAIEYYQSSDIKAVTQYKNGRFYGKQVLYYPNGQRKEVANYNESGRNGLYQSWSENGDLLQEGYYQNDKKIGKWKD